MNAFIRGTYCLFCGKGEGAIGDFSVMNFTYATLYFLNRSHVTGKPDSCVDDNNMPGDLKDMPLACPYTMYNRNLIRIDSTYLKDEHMQTIMGSGGTIGIPLAKGL